MDELQQEQFTKALLGLVDLAKTKKNVLQYGEINDASGSVTGMMRMMISFWMTRTRLRSSMMWMCWKVSAQKIRCVCI